MSEVTDYYGGTNSFECPWPEGATEACVKWVQNGTLTDWAPITPLPTWTAFLETKSSSRELLK